MSQTINYATAQEKSRRYSGTVVTIFLIAMIFYLLAGACIVCLFIEVVSIIQGVLTAAFMLAVAGVLHALSVICDLLSDLADR